jgi:uncharacterized protein
MNGYQVSFFTTMGRRRQGKLLKDWLIQKARALGIGGATVFAGLEWYGHDRRFHSAHFLGLADEPILVVTEAQKTRLFTRRVRCAIALLCRTSRRVRNDLQSRERGTMSGSG